MAASWKVSCVASFQSNLNTEHWEVSGLRDGGIADDEGVMVSRGSVDGFPKLERI